MVAGTDFSCGGSTGKGIVMALPTYTLRQLLEAGVHFGHHTRRWNPKMSPYIFGVRNGVHIIDLEQTAPMLHQGLQAIRDVVAGGGRVLMVGTKRQAQEPVAEAAKRCGQYYVNYRWLGGMLTNFKTMSQSIRRLRELDERIANEQGGLTKRELLELTRHRDKLERALGGIKEMGGLPDILFVIDTNKEAIAVAEANTLHLRCGRSTSIASWCRMPFSMGSRPSSRPRASILEPAPSLPSTGCPGRRPRSSPFRPGTPKRPCRPRRANRPRPMRLRPKLEPRPAEGRAELSCRPRLAGENERVR
jgi:ribosomal protein S2